MQSDVFYQGSIGNKLYVITNNNKSKVAYISLLDGNHIMALS